MPSLKMLYKLFFFLCEPIYHISSLHALKMKYEPLGAISKEVCS